MLEAGTVALAPLPFKDENARFRFPAPQLNDMYVEDARLLAIKETLIAKAQRIVTLKKSAVLAFMTAQFGVLGMHPCTWYLCVRVHLLSEAVSAGNHLSQRSKLSRLSEVVAFSKSVRNMGIVLSLLRHGSQSAGLREYPTKAVATA